MASHELPARHSHAWIAAEEAVSLTETPGALGQGSTQTNRVYVQRIAIKCDERSKKVSARRRELRLPIKAVSFRAAGAAFIQA
jgi:hypothetical protein